MGSGAVGPVGARPARLHDAYRTVFVAHRSRLVRLALLLGCDRSQVDDVVADAFARVFPHWVDGRVTDPGPYLRRTLVNGLVHGGRRLGAQRRWDERNRPVEPSDALDRGVVERQRLVAALALLPPDLRQTVVLRFCEDLSEAQTAQLLGVAVGTVKSRTARALARLRPLLEEDHD